MKCLGVFLAASSEFEFMKLACLLVALCVASLNAEGRKIGWNDNRTCPFIGEFYFNGRNTNHCFESDDILGGIASGPFSGSVKVFAENNICTAYASAISEDYRFCGKFASSKSSNGISLFFGNVNQDIPVSFELYAFAEDRIGITIGMDCCYASAGVSIPGVAVAGSLLDSCVIENNPLWCFDPLERKGSIHFRNNITQTE